MHQVMVCQVCELHMRLTQVSNPVCEQLLTLRVPCIQEPTRRISGTCDINKFQLVRLIVQLQPKDMLHIF